MPLSKMVETVRTSRVTYKFHCFTSLPILHIANIYQFSPSWAGVWYYVIVSLSFIPLVTNKIDHLFQNLSSIGEVSVQVFCTNFYWIPYVFLFFFLICQV